VYDPNQPNFGNSNFGNSSYTGVISWGYTLNSYVDVRLFYNGLGTADWSRCRWDPNDSSIPSFYRISPFTNQQICYTPEALLYAQSAYFISAIIVQIANHLISRTRYLSLGDHGVSNIYGNLSFIFETLIGIILLYIPPIEFAINTRAIASPHFFVPGITYSLLIFFYDEGRKYYLRRGIKRDVKPEGTKMTFPGWTARNTYY
jgi:hypothetical protein